MPTTQPLMIVRNPVLRAQLFELLPEFHMGEKPRRSLDHAEIHFVIVVCTTTEDAHKVIIQMTHFFTFQNLKPKQIARSKWGE